MRVCFNLLYCLLMKCATQCGSLLLKQGRRLFHFQCSFNNIVLTSMETLKQRYQIYWVLISPCFYPILSIQRLLYVIALLTQDVIWASIQRLLNVMDVRWTSKQHISVFSISVLLVRYSNKGWAKTDFELFHQPWWFPNIKLLRKLRETYILDTTRSSYSTGFKNQRKLNT